MRGELTAGGSLAQRARNECHALVKTLSKSAAEREVGALGRQSPGLPTALSSSLPAALQFAHGHYHKPEVPLHAMRDDGRPVRLRKVLLPLPIADGSPPVRGWPLLLQALPRSVRLYRFGVGLEF